MPIQPKSAEQIVEEFTDRFLCFESVAEDPSQQAMVDMMVHSEKKVRLEWFRSSLASFLVYAAGVPEQYETECTRQTGSAECHCERPPCWEAERALEKYRAALLTLAESVNKTE